MSYLSQSTSSNSINSIIEAAFGSDKKFQATSYNQLIPSHSQVRTHEDFTNQLLHLHQSCFCKSWSSRFCILCISLSHPCWIIVFPCHSVMMLLPSQTNNLIDDPLRSSDLTMEPTLLFPNSIYLLLLLFSLLVPVCTDL